MSMSYYDRVDIRAAVHQELAEIEQMCGPTHGTYKYVCECNGLTFLAHKRVGHVLRSL